MALEVLFQNPTKNKTMNSAMESISFLQWFARAFAGKNFFGEDEIAEATRHVASAKDLHEREAELFEQLYDIINPVDLISGQRTVMGFNEFEQQLSEIVRSNREKRIPRVHYG